MINSFTGQYWFLSNFSPSPVTMDGEIYPTVEHAFQAAKTDDPWHQARIRTAPTPNQAKRFGRLAPLREEWEDVRLLVMCVLLTQKFSNPELRQQLLATGDAELIEGNWWGDCYWGVCRGRGENHLGRLLMEIRQRATPTC